MTELLKQTQQIDYIKNVAETTLRLQGKITKQEGNITEYLFDGEFASLEMETLPFGYIDKTATGIGATSLALENKENVIILVPSINLVDNKIKQYPNKRFNHKVLGVYEGVYKDDVDKYVLESIQEKKPIKIIATVDAIYKLEHLIPGCRVIIDEFDKIFEVAGGGSKRMRAIAHTMNLLEQYKDIVTLITATPIDTKWLDPWVATIPQVIMNWSHSIKVLPIVVERTYPFKSLKDEFLIPLRKNGFVDVNGHIFSRVIVYINSVTQIVKVIRESGLDRERCAVIVGDSFRNDVLLGSLRRYEAGMDVDYLFITATGFQGIDLYIEDAMSIVVSYTGKIYQMIDLRTDLQQAISRNRIKDNPHYGKYIFIYNEAIFEKTEKELLYIIDRIEDKLVRYLPYANEAIRAGSDLVKDNDVISYTYETEDGGMAVYWTAFNSHKYDIMEVRRSYEKGHNIAGRLGSVEVVEPIILPKDIQYKDLVDYFNKHKNKENIDWGVYSTRVEWIEVIETCYKLTGTTYQNITTAKDYIKAGGNALKNATIQVRNSFSVGKRYTNKEVVKILNTVYKKLKIERKAKPADMYEFFTNTEAKPYNSGGRGWEIIRK